MLTRAHVSGSLNCAVRNAPETCLSWSIDSVCIFLQTVVCHPSPLFCMCSFEPCQLVDERNCDGSDCGVPPVCQVLCEPLTFCKCSLFQMCEVGDCHRFREEAVKLREGSGNLAAVIQGPRAPPTSRWFTPDVLILGHVQPSLLSPSCLGCTCFVPGFSGRSSHI